MMESEGKVMELEAVVLSPSSGDARGNWCERGWGCGRQGSSKDRAWV
jgi:hypothetical protein